MNNVNFEHTCERNRSRCTEEANDLRLLDDRRIGSRAIHTASELSETVPVDRTLGFYPAACERKGGILNFTDNLEGVSNV